MPHDEMSAEEYNRYLATGKLPARFEDAGFHILVGDAEARQVLPLNSDRYRKPYLPYQPAYGFSEWTEAQFQAEVKSQARSHGWMVYHTYDSRKSDKGFPDLMCAHPAHGTIWFECKNATKSATNEQRAWLAVLRASGQHAYLVRPKDIIWIDALLQGYDHLIPEGI